MMVRSTDGDATRSPPLEKGRSATPDLIGGSRVGIKDSRFDLTRMKTARARHLRRQSTEVETRLWQRLRNKQLGVDFRRQHPVGNYVLDFYAPAVRLAVELDGGQHQQSTIAANDQMRSNWLMERGVMVLRFWNSDVVQNLSGVLEVIAAEVAELQSSGTIPNRRWRADLSDDPHPTRSARRPPLFKGR
jgi:very-short-patch-repair endonuclease